MKVDLVYAGAKQIVLECDVEQNTSVADFIEQSGILTLAPDIDLARQKVGVYGRLVKLDSLVKEGDRIEIYRKITRILDDDDDDD